MSNAVQNFEFQSHTLRMLPDENGEPWFIAMDVAEILGYSDTYKMTNKLDKDEVQNRQIGGFGNRGVTTTNESGLYACLLRDKHLLKYQGNYSLMMRAPRAIFGGGRPLMYAVKKTIRE